VPPQAYEGPCSRPSILGQVQEPEQSWQPAVEEEARPAQVGVDLYEEAKVAAAKVQIARQDAFEMHERLAPAAVVAALHKDEMVEVAVVKGKAVRAKASEGAAALQPRRGRCHCRHPRSRMNWTRPPRTSWAPTRRSA
jgi:hypothetical protein